MGYVQYAPDFCALATAASVFEYVLLYTEIGKPFSATFSARFCERCRESAGQHLMHEAIGMPEMIAARGEEDRGVERRFGRTCPITASPTSPTVEVIVPGALRANRMQARPSATLGGVNGVRLRDAAA